MPKLAVLFVVLFFILSPLPRNLRLQGPRSKVLKLSPAELREAKPQLLPCLSSLGYPPPPPALRFLPPNPIPPPSPLPH